MDPNHVEVRDDDRGLKDVTVFVLGRYIRNASK